MRRAMGDMVLFMALARTKVFVDVAWEHGHCCMHAMTRQPGPGSERGPVAQVDARMRAWT